MRINARLRHTQLMASTGTLAVTVGSATAVVTFAVVSIIGSGSPRPDLGGPVVVERPVTVSTPAPAGDDGVETDQDES
jgi:hypothetical protein